jgi:hypothetical protein
MLIRTTHFWDTTLMLLFDSSLIRRKYDNFLFIILRFINSHKTEVVLFIFSKHSQFHVVVYLRQISIRTPFSSIFSSSEQMLTGFDERLVRFIFEMIHRTFQEF